MATSQFATKQLTSSQFVESTGAILFNKAKDRVCLIWYSRQDEWLLAKGRRNCGESRHDAALRETKEETGYSCRLLPVRMRTRAPPAIETEHTPDAPRILDAIIEPFMVTIREMSNGLDMKIIWWYIAVADEPNMVDHTILRGEGDFKTEFLSLKEALDKLTFQLDRDILKEAIDLVEASKDNNE